MPLLSRTWSPALRRPLRLLLPLGLAAVCAAGLAAGLFAAVRQPAQERLKQAEASYATARQTQQRVLAARQLHQDLATVWGQLPARTDFPSLVLAISELAKQNRVSVPGVTYSFQEVEDGLALKATMAFEAGGDYQAIRRFIRRLESAGPYLVIESLGAARSSNADRVTFQMRVATFLRPDQPKRGA